MKRELNKFFNPKSIAVIGASNNPKKVGGILIRKLLKFNGEIIPVNKNDERILGIKSYESVTKYKPEIDLAIIATPSFTVKKILKECGVKKIKNVIIISAGFSEVGNKKEEEKLKQIAKKYHMNVLGPNCFGICNPEINLDLTFSKTTPQEGDIAFVSQSGALWSYISDFQKTKISKFISVGNMSDLDFSDLIEYLSEDKKTKKIILYIESLKEGRKFIEVCKKCKKEIIAIKSGKTKEGTEATISHTGSLATDYEVYKGAFKQAKIKTAKSIAKAFGIKKQEIKTKYKKHLILTNAGGAGALVTDNFEERSLDIVRPPIDILGTAQTKDYKKMLDELDDKKYFENLIVIVTPQEMTEIKDTANEIVKYSKNNKVIALFLGENSMQEAKEILTKNKIPYYNSCC